MINMVKVVKVNPLEGHRLWVQFSDGTEGVRDYTDLLTKGGPAIEPLRDQAIFNKVFISFGVPSWPNGFDVDAINLQMELRERGALSHAVAE
jgi:Protein of unknown function (DUF2442)